jgi:hypothetical protein
MMIPAEWLAEVGLKSFRPLRASIQCVAPHELIAINQVQRLVRDVPLDANGFRRIKMIGVLERIRDDVSFTDPIFVARQLGPMPFFFLRDGVHRFYASLALGFTHIPAEVIEPSY